ncbi:hypothetical protein Val02_26990 [Virgisporangium aliadipatigenens]|uniref:Secreted protein n=1 Tax=Virgisporangium aliadipatigenens TaxID=741659 RepID=A0A8J3YKJ4_9ACTN|nr:hypothetical protein [Virgisporangium aliadipatigenens]GIJ45813.1 hypothetical protein Val02_26990 [Virgisporangium aliadipatigenens]
MSFTDWLGAIATALAAGAAFGSWAAARKSNQTASTVAAIEHERHHADRTPQFTATITQDGRTLDLVLVGPPGFARLDDVEISVRDAVPDFWPSRLDDPATTRHVEREHVLAYRCFVLEISEGGKGRTMRPGGMNVGDLFRFPIQLPDHGTASETYRVRMATAHIPMRLRITARRGEQVWTIFPVVHDPYRTTEAVE